MRVYRTLLLLYPRSFRLAYGEDMVAVFEEMRRDRSPAALWWRVINDALTSAPVQRMEYLMSSQASSRTLVTAFGALFVLVVALAVRGTPGTSFAMLVVALAACGLNAVLYLRSRAAYVEPEMRLHRHWWRYLLAAAACFGAAIVGSDVLKLDAWMLLFVDLIAGLFLVAMGLVLGVWHGASRLRAARH